MQQLPRISSEIPFERQRHAPLKLFYPLGTLHQSQSPTKNIPAFYFKSMGFLVETKALLQQIILNPGALTINGAPVTASLDKQLHELLSTGFVATKIDVEDVEELELVGNVNLRLICNYQEASACTTRQGICNRFFRTKGS